jgi:hypothetical protein
MRKILRLIIIFCLIGVSISIIGLYVFKRNIIINKFELVKNIEFRLGKFINQTSIPIGYNIEINYPETLEIQNDAEISVKVLETNRKKNSLSLIDITFTSNSFKITPKNKLSIGLRNNAKESIVITAKDIGNKKIHVHSKYLKNTNNIIIIDVIDKKTFIGITENNLNLINKISIILGFPSLLLLIIDKILTHRQNIKKEEKDKVKIYIPK